MGPMGYGDGSIVRTADGRLRVTVSIEGKRIVRMVPRRLPPREQRKAAEAIRRELVALRDAGLSPTTQTLEVYLRSWLGGHREAKRQRLRPRTLRGYESIVETSIIPALGGIRLDRLNESHIQRWVDGHEGSPQTIANHRAVLRRALNVAVRDRVLARNVAISVELPKADWDGGAPLSVGEARRLIARPDTHGSLWRLALDTGLRQAELLGLGWEDCDLEGGVVTVTSQLQRQDGAWVRVPTKAARTLERIAIAPATVSALREHRTRQAAERRPDWQYWGLVFVKPNGQPYHGADVLRAFHAACDAAGIPRRRFHDLRASTATLMRELGVPEDARMARLGHSTAAMARHYGKASAVQDRAAADALGEVLR